MWNDPHWRFLRDLQKQRLDQLLSNPAELRLLRYDQERLVMLQRVLRIALAETGVDLLDHLGALLLAACGADDAVLQPAKEPSRSELPEFRVIPGLFGETGGAPPAELRSLPVDPSAFSRWTRSHGDASTPCRDHGDQ